MEWISVKEKLPPCMLTVITTNGRKVTPAYRTSNDASAFSAWPPNQVTHWMPLPEPPVAHQTHLQTVNEAGKKEPHGTS